MEENNKNVSLILTTAIVALALSGCDFFHKKNTRESIFDKVVSIPKELVLDIPTLPPWCDELPGLKKDFADVEDGKLYYEEEGRGSPLVLINGGPGGTHHGFHPYFSRIKGVARIIYYDQRGTGKSSKDDTGKTYTIKQAVEDLDNLRKALKIDRWAVFGHSYGGLLAQCYALIYPEHCTGLILVTSRMGLILSTEIKPKREQMFISPAEQDAIENVQKKCNEGKLTTDAQAIYNKHLAGDWKHSFYFKPTNKAMVRKALYEWSPAPGFEESIRSEFGKIILQGKFDDFEIPTLIIEGRWDLLWLDIDRDQLRRNHPHAQFEVFEKSGHYIFADEPEKFFTMLKGFLAKSSKAQIPHKPGHRLTWPQQPPALLRRVVVAQSTIVKSEHERLIAACYEQALNEKSMDQEVWNRLIYEFIHSKKDYYNCLTALQKLEIAQKATALEEWQKHGYGIQAWKGHMLDLLYRRDEAVACYNEAIKTNNGRSNTYFDSSSMQINKQWLEERLKTPFTWELLTN